MRSLIGVAGQEQGVSDQAGRGHCQIINLHIYLLYICVGAPVLFLFMCYYIQICSELLLYFLYVTEEKNGFCFQ